MSRSTTRKIPLWVFQVKPATNGGNLKTIGTDEHDTFRFLLKELRSAKNLTQSQLAESLGLPQSYVSKYETGERRLDFVETATVCVALGIKLTAFAELFLQRLEGRQTTAKARATRKQR